VAITDAGLGEITMREKDAGKFRTPSLRNVELTSPYLHNGSARTIAEAIRSHPGTGDLREGQVVAVTAFLTSLTDRHFATDARYTIPKTACGKQL